MTDPQNLQPTYDALAKRALVHLREGTTDRAPDQMEIPVSAYLDPERYQRECQRIFGTLPVSIALSIEVPESGSYLARTIMGQPLLITRNGEGEINVFLNVCRHRGARVCSDGAGKQRKFACPYHAWVYDNDGQLTGIYGEKSFGDLDRGAHSLTRLNCAERHGVIFATLTPGHEFNIDEWLGDMGDRLASLRLDQLFLTEVRELESPGWKATLDGYLEVYHHDSVHRTTVGMHTIGNLLVHDTYGPHQRLTFARPNLKELKEKEVPKGEGGNFIRMIHSVFPNLSISGVLGDHCLFSQVWPAATPDRTITRQFLLASSAPESDQQKEAVDNFSLMTLQAVRDEDYAIVSTIQAGLGSGANDKFIFGRNEPGLQHYHTWIDRLMLSSPEDLQT
ncbi:aromatic ring-hydroxylating oxygenase subunit alpha [Pacificimonas sp. ICDLI1SI03]